jgi:2'-5' RNA ligase
MFVAIELDDRIKRTLPSVTADFALRASARQGAFKFVNPAQAHLTLSFLGDVQPPMIDGIISAMNDPIELRPFRIAFSGLGIFPPRGAPRVLWLAVSDGADDVIALQRVVARRLEALGLALEDRPFHPHLTIGRWRESRASDRPALPAVAPSAGDMMVDRVALYESRLSSEGPAHIQRADAPLTATS